MIMAFIYIEQFEWIKNYQFYQTMIRLFPNEGLHYLMTEILHMDIKWSIEWFLYIISILSTFLFSITNTTSKISNRVFSLIRIGSLTICIMFLLAKITMTILQSSWQISIFWTFIWIFILQIWAINSIAGLYHISWIIFMAQYYINLRQKSHGRRLQRFYGRLLRYERKQRIHQNFRQLFFRQIIGHHYQSFAMLQREIRDYNQQLKRYLSVIFTLITVLITYLVYLILMTEQNFIFLSLYIIGAHAHYVALSVLIIGCNMIKQNNVKILRLQRKCLTLSSTCERKFFHNYQLFKFETITSIQLNQPSGFQLGNGVIITSYTFILYLFYYDELIHRKFMLINNVHVKPMGRIVRPHKNKILLALTSILVTLVSILMIQQPQWIRNYVSLCILTRMFPTEGIKYLSASIVMCTINNMMNAFYATSTRYEQFQFLLPINDERWRNLNKQDSGRYEMNKDYVFSIARCAIISIGTLFAIAMIMMIMLKSLWKISIFWTIFWPFIMYIWTYHTGSAFLHITSFIFILQYYLNLRQQSFLRIMQRLLLSIHYL
ncbi:hypothetical protein DERF_001200 [Dermatophagoides farinae]|uniref:Uncharacterized protein n=1 Tax=Dermatophagoides farinae TaxID=6954 RepID=A0A922ID71_DERFA|nr:hypothetical protein DERF_001200 [Dermatophagoides farinae]